MKMLCLIIAAVILPLTGKPQVKELSTNGNYTYAFGLRGGESSGLTFKNLREDNTALEIIISAWPNDLGIFALWEKHYTVKNAEGFRYFFGVGGHTTFDAWPQIDYSDEDGKYWWYKDRRGFGLGLDGIIGMEYKIPPVPLSFTIDLKPYIEVNSDGNVYLSPDPGLSLRLTF